MADINKLTSEARKIIDTIEYIDLATVSYEGEPWSSPVWCVHDDLYNFYFYSPKNSQHSQNIRDNGKGFAVIYDSRAPEGTGFGVYMTVKVKELNSVTDIEKAINWLFIKKTKRKNPEDFREESPRRIYQVTPINIWVNDAQLSNGLYLDYRVPIKLIQE